MRQIWQTIVWTIVFVLAFIAGTFLLDLYLGYAASQYNTGVVAEVKGWATTTINGDTVYLQTNCTRLIKNNEECICD